VTEQNIDPTNVAWLVDNFTAKVSGVANTLVVSADGIALALSSRLDRASADQLAAIASGLASLTQGAARCLGDRRARPGLHVRHGHLRRLRTRSAHLAVGGPRPRRL
jgi:hypothetical protein